MPRASKLGLRAPQSGGHRPSQTRRAKTDSTTRAGGDGPHQLAEVYQVLHTLGLFDYAGDISVRSQDGTSFLIRRARVALDVAPAGDPTVTTANDILRVDLDGRILEGDGPPPIETAIHATIYGAKREVTSVVHAHPRLTVALSIGGLSPEPVFIRGADVTGGPIQIHASPDSVRTKSQAEALLATMGDSVCCLLPGHGVVLTAPDLRVAALRLINLEQSANMQLVATLVGKPIRMSPESIHKRQQSTLNAAYVEGIWRYYVASARSPLAAPSAAPERRLL